AGFHAWHLRQSLRAMGAATETDLRMYLTFPRIEAAERRRLLRALLEAGEVREIAVEEPASRRPRTAWYALAEDRPALAAPARRRVGRARSRRRPRRPGRLHPLARGLHRRRHGVGGTGRALVAARAAHAAASGIIWEWESEPMTVTRILLLAVLTSISVLG